jgi:hypothetical protein
LLQLTREHVALLRAEDLATDCAKDGTVVEVFERAEGAVARAHTNPTVQKLWERYAAVCAYVPIASLAESSAIFASFAPLEI